MNQSKVKLQMVNNEVLLPPRIISILSLTEESYCPLDAALMHYSCTDSTERLSSSETKGQ